MHETFQSEILATAQLWDDDIDTARAYYFGAVLEYWLAFEGVPIYKHVKTFLGMHMRHGLMRRKLQPQAHNFWWEQLLVGDYFRTGSMASTRYNKLMAALLSRSPDEALARAVVEVYLSRLADSFSNVKERFAISDAVLYQAVATTSGVLTLIWGRHLVIGG